jgi:L-fuconolactonase
VWQDERIHQMKGSRLSSTTIDAHVHVWDLDRADYPWLAREPASVNRSFDLDELLPDLHKASIDGVILVQAADNPDDTATMFATAATHAQVRGIVAWAPLDRPEDAAVALAALQKDPLFVGVRTLIHDLPDPDWLLRTDVDESLGMLEAAGIPFDIVAVLPRHLEIIPLISERHPDLRMVIDHLAKPPIGLQSREPWTSLISEAARNPNVFGKVSGLYAAGADPAGWTVDGIRPFFEHALEVFGPARLMYGGDWPMSIPAGGYERVWAGLRELFDDLDDAGRDRLLGGTAIDFYGLAAGSSTGQEN